MASSAAASATPPIPYVVASWLGYPLERIVAGLRRGSIAPPAGAPPGWLPPGADGLAALEVDGPDGDGDGDSGADVAPPSADDEPPSCAAGSTESPAADLRASCLGLVRSIDPSVGDQAFDALWRGAGADDAARAGRIGDLLWRTVTGASAPGDGRGDAVALAGAIAERGTRGTLVDLAGLGSTALAARARSDPAVLDALAALDAHAFTGVVGGRSASSPSDVAQAPASPSDAWIDDRAKFLAWREAIAANPAAARDAAATWAFVDRTLGDGATVVVGDDAAPANRVVFAREGGDRYVGGATVDRIHGGGGDDVLRGAAGDDLVEGARGDDILSGGAGRDRLDGGAGADEIAGGSGGDLLDGGAGDDVLDGGRGDDTLRGGDGRDTYEFARGDGIDDVADADGDGEIVLDGETLSGDRTQGVSYSTHDGADGATLVIRTGVEGDEIRIRGWREGMFGIRLDDRAQANDGAGTPSSAVPRTKPLLTQGDAGADVELAAPGAWREPGNESGSAAPGADDDASGAAVAPSQAFDAYGVLGIADWARASSPASRAWDDGAASPPGVDPAGVTAADLASALAGAADGHDDAESAVVRHVPALPTIGDDWSSALVPPEAPGRPHR